MSAVRHHTVPRFLLERFSREAARAQRVCQLEKRTGTPKNVGPRSATVRKHFYSIDIAGRRDTIVETALSRIESAAAPLVQRLAEGDYPVRERRAELALFVAASRLRTPIWRAQQRSLFEQFATAWWAETNRHGSASSMRAAFVGTEWRDMSDDELEAFRRQIVDDLDRGKLELEMPVNMLIQTFLQQAGVSAWIVFGLDWTLVRTDGRPFILADTPVSLYDPTPPYPGSGAGLLSSPNVELFIPLDPMFGLLCQPRADRLRALWDAAESLREMDETTRVGFMAALEGRWAEAIAEDDRVVELNLRSYATAQRYVYGTQEAVCDTRKAARRSPRRVIELTPPPPRVHILEDDPESPGVLRAWRVFEPKVPRG